MVPMPLAIPGVAITGETAALLPQNCRHERSANCIIFSGVRCSRRWEAFRKYNFPGRP